MPPRKKDAPSSSSTSTSNSSSSSSTSSSSSGSDSSSSDSENTSTSGGKSGQPSSDSDKKPTPKKKTASAAVTRSKSDASEPEKTKDKSSKVKTSNSTTSHKPPPSSATGHASSSDSEEESPKVNSKRKPQAKPKSSATVTPVPKGSSKSTVSSTTKSGSGSSNTKKVNPPRKVAQKSSSSTGGSGSASNKESSSSKNVGPKVDDQKKSKTKSIFSPDNTSEDSDEKATPPPPKLTAIKSSASKNVHNKTKTKPSPPLKARSSSVSSNSSDSSRSSRSSSDSSPDSSRTKTDNSSSAPNRKVHPIKKEKKSTAPPKLESDTDTGPVRKQTRSSSTRKSKHVISRIGSDSDSDTGTRTSSSKSPVKKVGPKGPPILRKPKSGTGEYNQHIEFEERSSCPLSGCDSMGHLSGKYDKHYILEACPRYHNMTPLQCKEALLERTKREEERKKAQIAMKPSPLQSPTPEQRLYREKVKEMRSKHATRDEINSIGDNDGNKDKQPELSRWSNKYDLKLFQEAQAVASEAIEEELRQLANVNCTKYIEMGKFEMEVWYLSPYPEDYARLPKLYICEYCLRYMKSRTTLDRHAAKCVWRHPPGEEVYRKEKISVWEVDGKRYKLYCQNLCLLAKFFLDHKTLYYDVEPFLFYVMTISDSEGCHTVGYFSKEKSSFLNYNVSCILTLPPYQRQGYGRLLIDFSYLLTRVENKIGSPEKPLSDLGLISYRSYWKDVLLEYLCNLGGKQISVKDISQEMAINSYDIVSTLQALGMMKYWKGKHIILKKQDVIDEYVERSKRRGVTYKEIDPECLKWTPFVPPNTPPGPN